MRKAKPFRVLFLEIDPVVYDYDYDFLDESHETETQAEEQNCLPEREYHYGYGCDAHQSQSFQDVVGEKVPAQPFDPAQVSQVESPCEDSSINNLTKEKNALTSRLNFQDNLKLI